MDQIIFQLSIVIIVTTVLSVILELSKQPILIAFIFSGLLIGPQGLGLITSNLFFEAIGQIGIILLLYLIGLELKAKIFSATFGKGALITLVSSMAIFIGGFLLGIIFQLNYIESVYLGIVFVFSSTVVVMKLLNDIKDGNPFVRQYCISALITQDILAIIALLLMSSFQETGYLGFLEVVRFLGAGAGLFALAYIIQRYILKHIARKVLHKADIMFLLGLAWCFLFAEIAEFLKFSREIGAFIAGISLTFLPAYKLKVIVQKSETIRDFFMILFFFVLGAKVEFQNLQPFVWFIIASIAFVVLIKPIIFKFLFSFFKTVPKESLEISVRLGQLSEFSVIVILMAASIGQISFEFAMAVEVIMFLSIIISTYFVQYLPKFQPQKET